MQHPYNQALATFVHTNQAPLAALFGVPEHAMDAPRLGKLLQSTIGGQLQTHFEFHGRFDAGILSELRLVPLAKRTAHKLTAEQRVEIGRVQNRSLSKVAELQNDASTFLSAQLTRWRTARMRSEMRKLAEASQQVELQTRRLVATIQRFKHNPTPENRYGMMRSMKGLNKSLLNIHYRARSAGAWAISAGFSPKAAAKALDHLYLRKMAKLGNSLLRLDTWLNSQGIKASMGAGVKRRQHIIAEELLSAQGVVNRNARKMRYPETDITPPGLEHG